MCEHERQNAYKPNSHMLQPGGGSGAARWLQAQFAARLVRKDSRICKTLRSAGVGVLADVACTIKLVGILTVQVLARKIGSAGQVVFLKGGRLEM